MINFEQLLPGQESGSVEPIDTVRQAIKDVKPPQFEIGEPLLTRESDRRETTRQSLTPEL